jgi:hypothetical protein
MKRLPELGDFFLIRTLLQQDPGTSLQKKIAQFRYPEQ